GGRGGGRGGRGRARRAIISDEIWATVVDHVLNHGLTMQEAGQRVQPNISRFSVASILRTFRRENRTERLPRRGGRERVFTAEQETAIVNMVLENNAITITQIQSAIIDDQDIFLNINTVSLATMDRVLRRNTLRMKQVYRVPFDRNSNRVKQLRYDYVQRVLELEAAEEVHEFIFIDEVGFNLSKRRRRGRNIIGQRAIVNVPGQRGGNITLCAAINHHGILHHHSILGLYNTARLLTFLDTLHSILIPPDQIDDAEQPRYIVIWDNVSFHRAALVRTWFIDHPQFFGSSPPTILSISYSFSQLFTHKNWTL
ncbi:hypothetical protein SKAU_G00425500, partial [Synaphobranchus kaupii]